MPSPALPSHLIFKALLSFNFYFNTFFARGFPLFVQPLRFKATQTIDRPPRQPSFIPFYKTADTVRFSGQATPQYANNIEVPIKMPWRDPENRPHLQNLIQKNLFLGNPQLGQQAWDTFTHLLEKESMDGLALLEELRRRVVVPNQDKVNLANGKWHTGRTTALTRQMMELMQAGRVQLPPHAKYLDLGCGEARVTQAFSQALNISPENVIPLEIADTVYTPFQSNGLTVHTYDGKHIPDAFSSPDLISVNSVLHHTQNEQAATDLLKDVYNKLAPGGYLIVREINISSQDPRQMAYAQLRHQLSIRVAGRIAPSMPPDTVYKTQPEWQNIAKAIGFQPIAAQANRSAMGGTVIMLFRKPAL